MFSLTSRQCRSRLSNVRSFASRTDPPGTDARGIILKGLALGVACGLVWKTWQWQDKAKRVDNNKKWDKYYPIHQREYWAQKSAELAAAKAESGDDEDVSEEEQEVTSADDGVALAAERKEERIPEADQIKIGEGDVGEKRPEVTKDISLQPSPIDTPHKAQDIPSKKF